MMADLAPHATGRRLSAWFRAPRVVDAPKVPSCANVKRLQYNEIGDFLAAYDLEFSDHNFAVVRAHLASDPQISKKIASLLRTPGCLTDASLAAIGKSGSSGIDPDYIADVAHQLNAKLAECLRIVDASSASGHAFRQEIETVESAAEIDPKGAVTQMIALTRCVVDATRVMEAQLDGARRETERLRNNLQRARRDADQDHLTQLPNRRVFERLLDSLPQDGTANTNSCVALCDIDDFKQINDSHGHETGDRVLRFIARFLRTALGDGVHLARYGGEEFACLFRGMSVHQARDLLDDARWRLRSRSIAKRDDGQSIGSVTFSAGLVRIAGEPRAAVRLADAALYEAKRAGKDRVVVGSSGESQTSDAA